MPNDEPFAARMDRLMAEEEEENGKFQLEMREYFLDSRRRQAVCEFTRRS